MRKPAVICFASLATLCMAELTSMGDAHAKGVICEHVQDDLIDVDGMTDDWEGFRSTAYGRGSDAAVEVHCAYTDSTLFVAVSASDQRLIRTKKGKAGSEDRLQLSLAAGGKPLQFGILPGSGKVARKALGVPAFVEVEDSLHAKGFVAEFGIPLKKIAGWSPTVPYLSGSIQFHDVDKPKGKAKATIGLRGKMHFSDAVSTYQSFMKAVGLKNRDVRLDALADVDTGAGVERVIVGGNVLGLLGTGYSFINLPIASPSDLIRAKVVDFDGSGRSAILTELRQHGNGGSREVLIVWFAEGDGMIRPALTVETAKQRGDAMIRNTWALVPRGLHRGPKKRGKTQRGFDLLTQVGEVTGFTQENFREAPAPDAKGILLPWGEKQSAVYFFEGSTGYGGDAATHLPKK